MVILWEVGVWIGKSFDRNKEFSAKWTVSVPRGRRISADLLDLRTVRLRCDCKGTRRGLNNRPVTLRELVESVAGEARGTAPKLHEPRGS